ncbi:MAG: LPS biosynthesis protein [Nitrospiraceae bacterium]|nr:MAG: LPS biosynthesis protein [Nitrospiraceae bacterium]
METTTQPPGASPAVDSPTVVSSTGEYYPEDEVSLLELANTLLRRRRLVFGIPVATAFLTAAVSLLIPPTFTATTAFVPEAPTGSSIPAGLSGLASQFGISLGGDATQLPQFYAQVLQSRELLDRILLTRYPDPRSEHNPPDSSTLLAILEVDGDSLADSLHAGREELADLISVSVDRETGIVTLNVDSRYPELAAAVANKFIEYLNEFNAQTRQSQARERRRFIEGRIQTAEQELRRAEEDLKTFYERNRTWQQSPQLVVEEDRLRRQVQLRQEVYLTLNREYETARIEEVNDTPVITVIDRAVPPQEKSKPKRTLMVILAFVLGGMVGVLGAFGAEFLERSRTSADQDYREFQSLLQQARDDLKNIAATARARLSGRHPPREEAAPRPADPPPGDS